MKANWFVLLAVLLPVDLVRAQTDTSPLPPVAEVIQRTLARAATEDENDRAFDQLYQYQRTRLTEFRNSQGQLKSREEKITENGSRTGPLAAAPAIPVDRPAHDEPLSETHSNIHGKALKVKDYSLAELVTRFQFTLDGREIINGRPTLVLDFRPASDHLPVHSYKDNFINKAAGRVWVDAADYAIAKADLHLIQQVNVLGGLVGAVWKFTYSFDRVRTPEGLWYARRVNWHLEGREVIFNRIVDYHEEKLDAKKVSAPTR
jgi:hypothetical protein